MYRIIRDATGTLGTTLVGVLAYLELFEQVAGIIAMILGLVATGLTIAEKLIRLRRIKKEAPPPDSGEGVEQGR